MSIAERAIHWVSTPDSKSCLGRCIYMPPPPTGFLKVDRASQNECRASFVTLVEGIRGLYQIIIPWPSACKDLRLLTLLLMPFVPKCGICSQPSHQTVLSLANFCSSTHGFTVVPRHDILELRPLLWRGNKCVSCPLGLTFCMCAELLIFCHAYFGILHF